MQCLLKITAGYFVEIDKLDSKIYMEIQGTHESQNNPEKVNINLYS